MPTYAYACTECNHRFDVVQSFSDDSLTVCPECEGRLRKVFGAVGVVFKGSGFYKTDSGSSSKPSPSTGAAKSTSDSSATGGSDAASPSPSTTSGSASSGASSSTAPSPAVASSTA